MNLFVSLFGISFGKIFKNILSEMRCLQTNKKKKIQGGGSSHIGVEQMSTESS